MSLVLEPSVPQTAVIGVPLCFAGSGSISLAQEDLQAINLPASGTNWTYGGTNHIFKKVSGTNPSPGNPSTGYGDCTASSDPDIYGFRPFYFRAANVVFTSPGGSQNNFSMVFFATDDLDRRYGIEIYNYGGHPNDWFMTYYWANIPVANIHIGLNDLFFVRSDGIKLYLERKVGCQDPNGCVVNSYSQTLPSTAKWKFRIAGAYVNNELHFVEMFKGTYQGTIPITWDVPDGGSLSGSDTNKCFLAIDPGNYRVCIDSDFDDQLCVDIVANPLYLEPTDFPCGSCVFAGDIVTFNSNGGLHGVLTAIEAISEEPSGTVLDALTWRAPNTPPPEGGHVILTYTIETVDGQATFNCHLFVQPRLEVLNVEGDVITGLVPGDSFQLITTYEYPDLVWENLSCPNIVTPEGLIYIPKTSNSNNCFGMLDCYIRARLVNIEGSECDNITSGENQAIVDLRIIVDPVYPTADLGGPNPLKWKQETPDFRVITKTMEGGCSETHIRNRVPVQRWQADYDGLSYEDTNECDIVCCDDPAGFEGGINPVTRTAKMLDDFWMLTAGEYGYFTLIEPRTGYIWRKVRFEGVMERDHINWRTIQRRNVKLIWNPCCATEPAGGVCPHSTTRTDTYPPSVPQNVNVFTVSYDELKVKWEPSFDDIGVKYYEVWIDEGEIIRVGSTPIFYHRGLTPSTTYSYKVQAYDFSGNPSGWSDIATGTTAEHDVTPPAVPENLRVTATESTMFLTEEGDELVDIGDFILEGAEDVDYAIQVEWDPVDDPDLAGYILLVDGYAIDMEFATTYAHTDLEFCSEHQYHVRSYDIHGNRSRWSEVVIGGTTCGEVLEGTDSVLEGVDTVVDS